MSWVICIFSGLLMPTEKNSFGEPSEKGFRKALSRMSVTVKNEDTREKDMMSCTDFYNYHGGLITAVHAVTGSRPFSLAGDSADPNRAAVRTTTKESSVPPRGQA